MRLFPRPLPENTAEEKQRGINMADLMMWLVIAALMLATAIQSIGYYQQASFTYQAKSDLAGTHSWAAARTALDTKAPTSTEMTAALLAGDLKLTNNGGVYNIGVIATTGDKYCLGVKSPSVHGNNVFYSTSDAPNTVMTDVALPAFCGTATEVTTTGNATVETGASASASPTPTPLPTAVTFSSQTAAPGPVFATSADLSIQVASVASANSQVSTNSGGAWTVIPSAMRDNAGGTSANGKYVLIGGNLSNGSQKQSYISTNSGATWTASTGLGTNYVQSVAISDDGTKIMVAGGSGGANSGIRMSTDGGTTFPWVFTSASSSTTWGTITGTNDLSTAYAVDLNGTALKTSTNSGVTWTSRVFSSLSSVAVSSTGKYVVLGFNNSSGVQVSNDYGANFSAVAVGNTSGVHSVDPRSISSDGQSMVVSDTTGVYLSRDAGVTWTKQTLPSATYVARISADGSKFLATTAAGVKYTG